MIKVVYTPRFVRHYKKMPVSLQDEITAAIRLFRKNPRHPQLRVHLLKGTMRGYSSFSVNYKYRIVFEWDDRRTAALLAVGDHSIYERGGGSYRNLAVGR